MKQGTCIEAARLVLTESFGVKTADCDHVLRTWSKQTQTPLAKVADVLVNQIWNGDQRCHDRALVRFLEQRLRQLPVVSSDGG